MSINNDDVPSNTRFSLNLSAKLPPTSDKKITGAIWIPTMAPSARALPVRSSTSHSIANVLAQPAAELSEL